MSFSVITSLIFATLVLGAILLAFPITQPAGALILIFGIWALVLAFAGAFD